MVINIYFLPWIASCLLINTVYAASFEVSSSETFPQTIIVGELVVLDFNYTIHSTKGASPSDYRISISISDEKLLGLVSTSTQKKTPASSSGEINVVVKGLLPGRTKLQFQLKRLNDTSSTGRNDSAIYALWIERVEGPLDVAFTIIVVLLVGITNMGLGCKVDLSVVKAQLKKPIAPAIGIFSQYLFMPLVSFLPLWLFTLGAKITNRDDIEIPYYLIFTALMGIIVPVGLGLLIQHKSPRLADFLIKSIKYVMAVFVIFVLTVGVYANVYVFYLMSPLVLLASALLPYVGFFLGGLAGFATCQDRHIITTIAVETGIQNIGVPIVLIRLSLTGPERDTGIVAPVASSILTPVPLLIALIIVHGRKWLRQRRTKIESIEASVYGESKAESNHVASSSPSKAASVDQIQYSLVPYEETLPTSDTEL
ncbi:Ileal sodium/bile acid cotransporter [Plakobranchus ocellatus]|uniref:Ileal sodium/bile acid cotransporter n=1 Tax=Plakobranchus ocellatus TaxID=259542 RepID=A0AAV4AYU1_9GAST|nr:Ileal sodium/bile acid cotransporter [Plakobranchus ocellatus]